MQSMALTEKQVQEYRRKLENSEYMRKGINGIADKILKVYTPAVAQDVELNINNVEEKNMARNKLIDLNDHLMERIEWLNDREIKGADLTEEIRRSEAVSKVAAQVVANANLILKACVAKDNSKGKINFPMIEDNSK